MYIISLSFHAQHRQTLGFKTATEVFEILQNYQKSLEESPSSTIKITDNFGHIAIFTVMSVVSFVITDLEKEFEFNSEVKLMEARASLRLQQRAQADPALKFLNTAANSNQQ